jgi:hypothetical protein
MPNLSLTDPRNLLLARKAKKFGMKNSLRTVIEAKRAGIPVSLGFAMVEQESGDGSNIFGHDPTIFSGAGQVTKSKYLAYKAQRGRTRMQGVGPMQLTWWEFQDAADRRGGSWVPRHNIAEGFTRLASLIRAHGKFRGIALYNGSGPRADAYARSVLERERKWHSRLT